jgi:hypothetical protein
MTTNVARKAPIRLSYRDGQVMVTPEDQDIFFISAEKAAEACRQAVQRDDRVKSFKERFLVPLHRWCERHMDRVAACYLPVPSGYLQAFIVTNSKRFDFELGDQIAALERELSKDGWQVGLSQLPAADDRSLTTFFNPEGALEIYAQRESTPEQGGKES